MTCRTSDAAAKLRGRRVTIMGLGRHGGGVAAARYCAQKGAVVTVTDLADRQTLADSLAQLEDVAIEQYRLGEHRECVFHTAEVIVVNPAVRPKNALIEAARRGGAEITSETELFLDACPATVVGVTGTVGKSTTATMLAGMIAAGGRRSWLGGNIGHSLLADLPNIEPDDIVVLELSSFQLHWLNEYASWPKHAIVTNCSPNHLEWHETWGQYTAAKRRLMSHLPREGIAVVSTLVREVALWTNECCGRVIQPDHQQSLPSNIRGAHNQRNASLAAAMAKALGIDGSAIFHVLEVFKGLPHRIEFVAERGGRACFNDSKSTTPAATIAALTTMNRPTWLLLGGIDKETQWRELVEAVLRLAQGAALFGAIGQKLESYLHDAKPEFPRYRSGSLDAAVAWCWQQSKPGDAILLSPACASTDQYRDFMHRGEEFRRLVSRLPLG